jgi:drug/metabolite transporter (DMT)-like permease
MTAALSIIAWNGTQLDFNGVLFAIASGAITSGIGYAIWYSALPGLKATQAATVQLSVPVIAALGGILLIGEPLSLRLVLASMAILAGIGLVIFNKQAAKR